MSILGEITRSRFFQDVTGSLIKGGVALHETVEAGLGVFLAALHEKIRKPVLYLGVMEEKTRTHFGDASLFTRGARFFPRREAPPLDDPMASGERALILEELLGREKLLLFSTPEAVLSPTRPPKELKEAGVVLEVGASFPMSRLAEMLESWGYSRVDTVVEKEEFAVRGGIVDCFPLSAASPYRVEWFGDEIDSIRAFDPASQRSVQKASALHLFPPESAQEGATLLDYLSEEWILAGDPAILQNSDFKLLEKWSSGRPFLRFLQAAESHSAAWPFQPVESFTHRFRDFLEEIRETKDWKTVIFTRQSSRIKEILQESHISGVEVLPSPLSRGFKLPESRFSVYTDGELFGRVISPFKRIAASRPVALEELEDGEIVVHARHGIARYGGLIPLEVQGNKQDYLALEFSGEDRLYVPLEEIDMVERYVGPPGKFPPLSKMGGREWRNAKKKAKKAAEEIAEDLVRLYAERGRIPGHSFSPDSPWQREMEEAFPFEETPDQRKAVNDTKTDMESQAPMDRLIVGDVGFGKTEVALRAAFKAVMDGKQVAILVPTTVLAQQHYETFSERLATFPVRVDVLSRFKKKKEQNEILLRLFSGEIDILIGTHRILQRDVHFKNLGLLIVDEEQRFGVAHKEGLKKLKQEVDSLTLSATPIPRTFYLSLVGVRDISVIDTPPKERLPVKTFVLPRDPTVLQQAIRQELAREGQVYYLYNRVETIKEKEKELKDLVPEARVISAHGQMKEEKLEEVMWEFMQGLYDVLLCTTIIENGLDIPRVNTLIVENAHRFGLAQLYQLRGRVGRSNRQAYAYFFLPSRGQITHHAEQRLSAIQEFTHLGSGYQIAIKDLEIRGAGNLLGLAQHGHLASVGYHLYCQMIADEIKNLKGEKTHGEAPQIHLDLPVAAFIPDAYAPSRSHKLDLYRRLAACKSPEEVGEIFDEMVDRFGDPPPEAQNLLEMVKLRLACLESHVYEITAHDGEMKIRYWDGRSDLTVPLDGKLPVKVSFDLLKSKIAVVQ